MSTSDVFAVPVRLFDPGQIVATPAAIAACDPAYLRECLSRHLRGDWGNVCKADWKANFDALFSGSRLLSAYAVDSTRPAKGHGDNCLWIITEADRSTTTMLLPSEY